MIQDKYYEPIKEAVRVQAEGIAIYCLHKILRSTFAMKPKNTF
jgi:hypothetical protein